MIKIFVIIVTYNGSKWYDKCFESLKISNIPIRIIVVDNASSDNTVSYIKRNFPEIHLIANSKNLGFGKANNIGIEYALKHDCDYVFLLNQDAWILPDTIEKLYEKMECHQEFGILSPFHLRGDGLMLDNHFSFHISPVNVPNLLSDFVLFPNSVKEIYNLDFVNAAFWFISKKCLKKVGLFDPLFPHYGEDNDYANRVKYHQLKIGVVPNCYAYHDRSHEKYNLVILSFEKQLNWLFVNYLIELKNINISSKRSVADLFSRFIKNSIKYIFEFKLQLIVANLFAFIRCIACVPKILSRRNLDKILFNR